MAQLETGRWFRWPVSKQIPQRLQQHRMRVTGRHSHDSHLPRYARPAPAAITPRATTAHVRVRGLQTSLPRMMTLPFIVCEPHRVEKANWRWGGKFWIKMRNRDTSENNPRARKVCSGVRGAGGKFPAGMGGTSIPGSRLGYGVGCETQVLQTNGGWRGGGRMASAA